MLCSRAVIINPRVKLEMLFSEAKLIEIGHPVISRHSIDCHSELGKELKISSDDIGSKKQ